MTKTVNVVACVKIRTEPEVKAEALREAAEDWYSDNGPWAEPLSSATWLRERADRLECRTVNSDPSGGSGSGGGNSGN